MQHGTVHDWSAFQKKVDGIPNQDAAHLTIRKRNENGYIQIVAPNQVILDTKAGRQVWP